MKNNENFVLQSSSSSLLDVLTSGRLEVSATQDSATVNEFMGVNPGCYFWEAKAVPGHRKFTREYEVINAFQLKKGELFSLYESNTMTLRPEVYILLLKNDPNNPLYRKSISQGYISTLCNISKLDKPLGNLHAAERVCRYRPTKEEELRLLPFTI